ncbi:hypothetical protein [Microvirga zambiensis]|nr:hypothetical protein [Microvirga zambiensis]
MTGDKLPLAELMAKADDGDILHSVAENVLQIPTRVWSASPNRNQTPV